MESAMTRTPRALAAITPHEVRENPLRTQYPGWKKWRTSGFICHKYGLSVGIDNVKLDDSMNTSLV